MGSVCGSGALKVSFTCLVRYGRFVRCVLFVCLVVCLFVCCLSVWSVPCDELRQYSSAACLSCSLSLFFPFPSTYVLFPCRASQTTTHPHAALLSVLLSGSLIQTPPPHPSFTIRSLFARVDFALKLRVLLSHSFFSFLPSPSSLSHTSARLHSLPG